MLKQSVFALALVAMVSHAHAVGGKVEGKEGGKAQGQALHEAAEMAKKNGAAGKAQAKEIDMAKAGQKLDKYVALSAQDKETIIKLSLQDAQVHNALKELIKSRMEAKKTGNKANDDIDAAQANALQALAKIEDIQKKVADGKLEGTEKAVFNLVTRVPAKARAEWTAENKAIASEALNIFGEASRDQNNTLDQAWSKMETEMANHKDKNLKATINKDAVEKWCS